MNKKTGRVINTVVSDVERFSDLLERYLCIEQISYVHVDNEFHFLDRIFRFYNYSQYLELCDEANFSGIDGNKIVIFNPMTILEARNYGDLSFGDAFFEALTSYDEKDITSVNYDKSDEKKKVPVYTKKMMLHDNRAYTQKMKQNISQRRIDRHFY